jgi:hypothetical protein
MNPTTATILAASIPAALTAGSAAFVGWLQNRKTRARVQEAKDAVKPVSNGFAAGVNEKLQLILDTQKLHGQKFEYHGELLDTLNERVADHLADHKHGRVVPIRKRAS